MSWQRYRYYDFFPQSTPKKAKGGIKAQIVVTLLLLVAGTIVFAHRHRVMAWRSR